MVKSIIYGCLSKRAYPTKDEADMALAAAKQRIKNQHSHRKMGIYRCALTGEHYHIGHKRH